MQSKAKKMWAASALCLVAFTSIANAQADNAQMRNLENRVSALEQRRGASGMVNPPGRPQVKGGADLFAYGDLLYWNAHENGLSYAVVNEGSSSNLADAEIKNIHGKWNWGFRVGAGYNLPHDGWDLRLTWLRFTDNGHKRVHADGDEQIFPDWTHPKDPIANNSTCKKAHSHFNLTLNQLDLDLGREFFVSKWMTLRPHFGLRSDWIRQKWENDYRNFVTQNATIPNRVETEYKDRWWGIGLQGGLDTQWGLGGGVSLFADLTAAIIYGFHDIKMEQEDTPRTGNDSNDGTFVNIPRNTYRISHPILDLAMGLRYDCMFSDDRFHVGLQAGWEHHVYLSQNQFPKFVDDISLGTNVRNQGDLALQGWTFSARFDF
jgi:hypothetical protein